MNEFLVKFAAAMEIATVTETDELRSFPEWDSLAKLCVISMIDSSYGVTVGGADLDCANTPGELWELLQIRKKSMP